MTTEIDAVEENEAGVVAEKLIQHLTTHFHPYTLAAIGTALVVLNDDMEDEVDMEECIAESCRTLFEFTIAFMYRVGEKEQEMLWGTSLTIGKSVFGDLRVQEQAGLAVQEHRKREAEMDDEYPSVPTRLN